MGTFPSEAATKTPFSPGKASFFTAETPFFGPTFSWKPTGKKYVVRKKAKPAEPVKEPQTPEPPPAPSVGIDQLNESEKKAWKRIQDMGGLPKQDSLTEMGLKRAYRKLAKKYHPDTETGSPEAFLKLQEAYSTLLKGFYRAIATCGSESASA